MVANNRLKKQARAIMERDGIKYTAALRIAQQEQQQRRIEGAPQRLEEGEEGTV